MAPADADQQLVNLIGKLFISRRDVHAKQARDGAWYPVRPTEADPEAGKWTRSLITDHIHGRTSVGHYLLDQDNKTKLFAFDIDLVKKVTPDPDPEVEDFEYKGDLHPGSPRDAFRLDDPVLKPYLISQLRGVADGLAARAARMYDVQTAISFSGSKGLHVYCFTGHMPAADVRTAALDVIDSCGVFRPTKGHNFYRHDFDFANVEVEVFPKQDSLTGKDLGNLMRLPLGKHAASGAEAYLIDPGAPDDILAPADPVAMLEKGIRWDV